MREIIAGSFIFGLLGTTILLRIGLAISDYLEYKRNVKIQKELKMKKQLEIKIKNDRKQHFNDLLNTMNLKK